MRNVLLPAVLLTVLHHGSASAGVESMNIEREESENCSAPHEQTARWLATNGELRLAGTGPSRFEFYGHGIDLSPNARIDGISGASARLIRGVGGIVNGPRGCGNIGSAVVEVTLPKVSSANKGTLVIGSERIAIKAVPYRLIDVTWTDANRTGAGGASSSGGGPASGTARGGPSLVEKPGAGCGGPGLPPCGGNEVRMPGLGGPYRPSAGRSTLADCLKAKVGGKGELLGDTLTITLPMGRNVTDVGGCANKGADVQFRLDAMDVHAHLSSGDLRPAMSASGSGAAVVSYETLVSVYDRHYADGRVLVSAQTLRTLVGEHRLDLVFALPNSSSALKLVLKSDPDYGVASISGLAPTACRYLPMLPLVVQFAQATRQGQSFSWNLLQDRSGTNPSTCFHATQGTLSPEPGRAQVDLLLGVKEDTACYGKTFRVQVQPKPVTDQGTVDVTLHGREASVVLPARSNTVCGEPRSPSGPVKPIR